jgi:CubicO group peptidase (beta-lactamase class C family)
MADVQEAALPSGFVAPGFEDVRDALTAGAKTYRERGCAVSAYVDGTKVVDLWWGEADSRPWEEDTLAMVFSATKGAVALCTQILADRGVLDVEAPVSRYWPEYAANGKESTLVEHLLNHTAGVLTVPRYWEVVGSDGSGFTDWELMTASLAAAPPSWKPGSRDMYHGLTFGYLVGEVIRRIDGRTVGRFFAEEVAAPLGLELYIGTPASVHPRITAGRAASPDERETMTPDQRQLLAELERRRAVARELVKSGDVISVEALPWSSTWSHPDLEEQDLGAFYARWNSAVFRQAELPSGNGITTARHLARMYALLACGGELDGVRLVSPESIERFRPAGTRLDPQPGLHFGLGYHNMAHLSISGADSGAFGHQGAGGILAFADPARRLGFAFVRNELREDWRAGADLAAAIYRCLY